MNRSILISLFFLLVKLVISQEMTVDEYISKYSDIAVEEMKKFRIPASITLAQGILESGSGNSNLARKANNHFGIKCHKGWEGKTFHMDDDEKNECFRKYNSPEESYRDHSVFLTTRDRYNFLFDLELTDYKAWARGLKQAGYATNPMYPDLLIRIIEENKLDRFDRGGGASKLRKEDYMQTAQNIPVDNPVIDYELVGKGGNGRDVFKNNKVKCVFARQGDTWINLAEEFGIYGWQIRKYNELDKKDNIMAGEVIYLEKKKKKSVYGSHTVEEGEDMRNISQRYAVKVSALYRLNGMQKGEEPKAGTVLKLK